MLRDGAALSEWGVLALRGEERSHHSRGNFRLSEFPFLKDCSSSAASWLKAKEPLGGANDWPSLHLGYLQQLAPRTSQPWRRLRVFNYLRGNGWTRNCLPFKWLTEENNGVSLFHLWVLSCEEEGHFIQPSCRQKCGESAALAQPPDGSHFKIKNMLTSGFLMLPANSPWAGPMEETQVQWVLFWVTWGAAFSFR